MAILRKIMPKNPNAVVAFVVLVTALSATLGSDAAAETVVIGGYAVTYVGRVYDATNDQTTYTYVVSGAGARRGLSHWVLGLCCAEEEGELVVVSASPMYSDIGLDPTTGVCGIKWEDEIEPDETKTFSFTVEGNHGEKIVLASVKAGQDVDVGEITGPSCTPDLPRCELKILSTDTRWSVLKSGDYAIEWVTVAWRCSNDLVMQFRDFSNLLNTAEPDEFDTFYYAYLGDGTIPGPQDWVPAEEFNNVELVLPKSEEFDWQFARIWQRIIVGDCDSACEYESSVVVGVMPIEQREWVDGDGYGRAAGKPWPRG